MRAHLTRRYHFSSSHRLHNDAFTETQNREVYGKCNNPFGHGHNYVAEITLSGVPDASTGMIFDLVALDTFAQKNLVDAFDHINLNTLECFTNLVPTTENLTTEIYRRFADVPVSARLERIRVEETGNNAFEYTRAMAAAVNAQ
jgi:6-pyruvoyltetrahydropterin/6-carboxytetrahydropterin synthase